MPVATKPSIRDKRQVVEQFHDAPPVNVIGLAKALGLRVYETKEWPEDISGAIVRDSDKGGSSGFAIYVNGKHNSKRQRFTIAHEIAHYILHEDLISDGLTDDKLYRSFLRNRHETQANNLAADILMPWKLINHYPPDSWSVRMLAEKFDVSESAMAIRLGVPAEE